MDPTYGVFFTLCTLVQLFSLCKLHHYSEALILRPPLHNQDITLKLYCNLLQCFSVSLSLLTFWSPSWFSKTFAAKLSSLIIVLYFHWQPPDWWSIFSLTLLSFPAVGHFLQVYCNFIVLVNSLFIKAVLLYCLVVGSLLFPCHFPYFSLFTRRWSFIATSNLLISSVEWLFPQSILFSYPWNEREKKCHHYIPSSLSTSIHT